jgi:hypothetical protein
MLGETRCLPVHIQNIALHVLYRFFAVLNQNWIAISVAGA